MFPLYKCFSHLALQPRIQANKKTLVPMTLAPAADGPRPPDLARAHCQLPAQGRVRIVSRFVTASRSGTLNGGVWEASLMPLALFFRRDPTFPTRGLSGVQRPE